MSTLEDPANATNITEFDMLKERAKLMGITHSNNISLETLRKKIEDKMNGVVETKAEDTPETLHPANPLIGQNVPEKRLSIRDHLVKESMALVRVRITNLDPKKKDLHGEIIAVANEYLGTVRKFVPFGEVTDDGYHIPKILYDELKSRKFQNIRTIKDRRTNVERVDSSWQNEFALEILPQLTETELKKLATAQLAAGSVETSKA